MTGTDEESKSFITIEKGDIYQACYDHLRRTDLQDHYDYKTVAVLDELLVGFLRRETCSGMGIIPFLEHLLSKTMQMDLPDVQMALEVLQNDGLIYWHKTRDFVLATEYWRHN
jgi:hypothetical protein